ncbi:MAG TPA: multicopper oxidase domain-containing protein [Streptosporangiaceae bacterium]|nr:multicopper oxidase domain-containing protein [Streptosporangiaceae bacterium]
MAGGPISRRAVLSYGAGIAGATYAGLAAKQQSELAHPTGPAGPAPRPVPPRPAEFPTPRVLSSAGGELRVALTARRGIVDLGAPRLVRTYTFNNAVPGCTWEVRGGDTLRVHLRNRLPPARDPVLATDRPHAWTTTNLHTHGLHVPPAGNADNVFLEIPPGEDHHLEIPLPRDHPGGIFWYHPHCHGAVTQQLRAGMAGALIVRGAIDEVEEVAAAREHVMVLQSIELGDDYQLLDPIPEPTPDQSFFPRTNVLYTVNGALNPTLRMYPGEVQRWRLLNAAEGKFMSLHLRRHDFHVLAWDGLTLPAPDATDVLMLSAGNRAEVLVRAGRPGRYHLVLAPGSSQRPDIPGMPASGSPASRRGAMATMPGFPPVRGELDPRTILTVEVAGHGRAMGLPTGLPAFDPPILPIARRREFAFTAARTAGHEFLNFGVDGIPFDPARPPYRPVLGTAEEWTLTNAFDPKLMEHAHVFHVHTNPFKITKRNGTALSPPLWRDTYVLTKGAGDSITFESNFVDYPGKFVEHCQVVSHEDLGMMSSIEVIPPDESSQR